MNGDDNIDAIDAQEINFITTNSIFCDHLVHVWLIAFTPVESKRNDNLLRGEASID